MEDNHTPITIHPMGELSNPELNTQKPQYSSEKIHCDTFAGLVHVEWDEQAPITPIGQLVFFAQFLKTCHLYAPWTEATPEVDMTYFIQAALFPSYTPVGRIFGE